MAPMPDFFGPLAALAGFGPAARIRRGFEILATAPRPPAGLTPHQVAFSQGRVQLKYYAPPSRVLGRLPIVLVPSLINRAYILDLEPGRSMVEALAAMGHPTFLVDWGVPGPESCGEDVDDVLRLLRRNIDRACRHVGARRAVLFGYCMGGTLAALLAARYPERIAGLLALNAPILFSEGGRFAAFVRDLDVNAAFHADGLVPVSAMKPAFQLLDPVGNISKHLAIEAASHDREKLARVLVRERWLEENVPLPGAFARTFIREGYQRDGLMRASWVVDGQVARLDRIAVPTLVVACQRDFITPPASATPLAAAVRDGRAQVLDTGHIGVVVGSEGPRRFFPMVDDFARAVAA